MIYKTQKGFTLIEAFVAITILLMATVGPLAIASQSATFSSVSRDQVMANFLAQDAIEYIRWVRDTNELKSTVASPVDWLSALAPCISGGGATACYFDSSYDLTHMHINSCSGVCPTLNFNPVSGLYNYDTVSGTNKPSHFTRTVYIKSPVGNTCAGNNCEISITATVSWKNGTLSHHITLQENLMPAFGI